MGRNGEVEEVIPTAMKAPADQRDQAASATFEMQNIDSAAVPSVVN
jgi:hypothetical protein